MLPVRCFTCNKVIGQYENIFKSEGKDLQGFFEKFNISRYCCQKIFMTHIDVYQYNNDINYDNIEIRSGNIEKKILKAD